MHTVYKVRYCEIHHYDNEEDSGATGNFVYLHVRGEHALDAVEKVRKGYVGQTRKFECDGEKYSGKVVDILVEEVTKICSIDIN